MTFDAASGEWVYTLDNTKTQALKAGQEVVETFIFSAEGADDFAVLVTVSGVNDAPVVDTLVEDQTSYVGQEITPVDLSNLFSDPDGDRLILVVRVADGRELSDIGLSYDPETKMITGILTEVGAYRLVVTVYEVFDDLESVDNPATIDNPPDVDTPPVISGDNVGAVSEDDVNVPPQGPLLLPTLILRMSCRASPLLAMVLASMAR